MNDSATVIAPMSNAAPASASSPKRSVLFLVDGPSTLDQQVPMILALDSTGRWETYLVPLAGVELSHRHPIADARIERLFPGMQRPRVVEESGDGAGAQADRAGGGLQKKLASILRRPWFSIPRECAVAAIWAMRWRRERAFVRRRLAQIAPCCIITPQERSDNALPVVAAARDLDIPVILAPAAGLYMPDGGAFMRRNDPSYALDNSPGRPSTNLGQKLLNRLVGWVAPGQVFDSRWGRMLYRPAHWYIGAFMAGLCPTNAWCQGTRFVDAIIISGEDERWVCERSGIPASRLVAIGSPALQFQYERRQERERLRAELGVRQEQMLIMLAVPQLWEHRMIEEAAHFAFVDRLFAVLAKRKTETIVSLHPKMDRGRYAVRVRAAGLRLADRPLMEILAAADLFIAGAYSSTIRWAMAVNIPCINLDLWELDESTYRHITDYPTVRSWAAMEDWVDRQLGGGRPKQERTAPPPMGLICDGRFGERFVALVEGLAKARK